MTTKVQSDMVNIEGATVVQQELINSEKAKL